MPYQPVQGRYHDMRLMPKARERLGRNPRCALAALVFAWGMRMNTDILRAQESCAVPMACDSGTDSNLLV